MQPRTGSQTPAMHGAVGAQSASDGVWTQPDCGSQVSIVHGLASKHVTGVPTHDPATQRAPTRHRSWEQSMGAPERHTPAEQWSPTVQGGAIVARAVARRRHAGARETHLAEAGICRTRVGADGRRGV